MRLFGVFAGLGLLALSCAALAKDLPTASVVYGFGIAADGDSLTVGQTRVRLFGIDAPEFDQLCGKGQAATACGALAAEQLRQLVTGREIRCQIVGQDQYDRLLGKCSVGAVDINRLMVSSGHATAYRRYSLDYVSAEDSAKAQRKGIWATGFQAPETYRHPSIETQTRSVREARTRPAPAASSRDWAGRAKANCNIKGNRSRRGEWIYHVPGMPYYEQTRAEDLFCTEAEAEAAGYRRAIVRR